MAHGPEFYEAQADRLGYGPETACVDEERLAWLERLVEGSVLDVGCATGIYVNRFAAAGREAHGVDFAGGLIDVAAARGKGTFHVASAESLPFPDARFDTVMALDLLEHVADDDAVLRELVRVSARRVIAILPARAPDDLRKCGLVFQAYEDPSHRRYYERGDAAALGTRHGLRLREIHGIGRVDVNGYLLRTLRFPRRLQRVLRTFLFKLVKHADVRRDATAWIVVADRTTPR